MPPHRCRVLHFIDSAGVYGAERVILNLSTQLQRVGGYVPVVGCIVQGRDEPSALFDAAASAGIEALKIPIANSRLWRDLPRAASLLAGAGIDLIHSHGYKPSVYGEVIRRRMGVPILATCHLWFEPSSGPLKMRVMVAIERRLYRGFPAVVAVSEPIREILVRHGVPQERTAVVANGVEVPEAPPATRLAALRRELDLADDDFVVLNAGRLTRQKAQWLLLEAAAILKNRERSFRFVIVGEGPLKQELRRRAEQLGVAHRVGFLGFRDDMDALLQMADAFALPSLDEGMPMALLESAAAGLPAVTTAVGDIGKLIVHEQTGLLIPGEDAPALAAALERLYRERELAGRLAAAAHQAMVDRYSSQAMTRRYVEVYERILSLAGKDR